MYPRKWQEEDWKTKEDMVSYTEKEMEMMGVETGVTQGLLQITVPDAGLLLPNVQHGMGGTKSK